jgi:hypothetical protein
MFYADELIKLGITDEVRGSIYFSVVTTLS